MRIYGITRLLLLAILPVLIGSDMLIGPRSAHAQLAQARFGFGLNTLLSSDDGLGIGFRGRISTPVNSDLSFAADLGITGFVLEGRDDAVYVIDPQISAIVTLTGVEKAPYILAGVGGYFVTSDNSDTNNGPLIHLGVGWVKALRETMLFYEIDPAIVIGQSSVSAAIPFRIGVIF